MTPHPTILSIQVGKPRDLGTPGSDDPLDKPWRSAIIKSPISGAVRARREGLEGDGQADRRHHGGFDKAILAYSAAHYPAWQSELGLPPPSEFGHGAFGENLTIEGLDESSVCIGDIFGIGGEVRVEVSQPRQPCMNLTRLWRRDMMNRVKDSGRTGWYLRVVREGSIESGMQVQLMDRPHPDWTVARATTVMASRSQNRPDAEALAGLSELSISWKETLAGG